MQNGLFSPAADVEMGGQVPAETERSGRPDHGADGDADWADGRRRLDPAFAADGGNAERARCDDR